MKISAWLIIAVVAIWYLFIYKGKKQTSTDSAATNSPLDNLKANISGSNAAADLVAQVVEASQGKYASDIYDQSPIGQKQVKQGDFIKVTPIENILTAQTGERRKNKRKADHMWWPQVMHDEIPAWNKIELEPGNDGTGDLVLIFKK